jgi:peptidoglycan/LPS O-acetylase OafA/YrhL
MLLIFALFLRGQRSARAARIVVGAVIATISLASFTWALWETANVPNGAFFSTFSRTWELGLGALLAVAAPVLTRIPAPLRPVLAWFGMAGMVASLFLVHQTSAFPAPAAALPVLSAALVILAGTGVEQQQFLFPLTNRVSSYVGDISYSLYVWHFPIIILGGALVTRTPLTVTVMGLVIVITAVYSYHLVEDPIRRSTWLSQPARGRRRYRVPVLDRQYQKTALSFLGHYSRRTRCPPDAARCADQECRQATPEQSEQRGGKSTDCAAPAGGTPDADRRRIAGDVLAHSQTDDGRSH